MFRLLDPAILLLASLLLSDARHIVFISQNGEKTHLPSSTVADVCITPECVVAAADVLNSLDETVDPCDDFYSFACGRWMKRHEVSDEQPKMDLFVETRNNLDRKLRELLESKYKSSDPPFVTSIKNLFNTCVDLDRREIEGSKPLIKMLRRLGGGWPVVEGSQWDESTFDWADTLISFRKLGYDYKFMLDFNVHYDSKTRTVYKIYIKIPYMGKLHDADMSLGLDDPEIAAHYTLMLKVAKLLGADESTAERELLEALRFEMALINITNEENERIYSRSSYSEKTRNRTMNTIAELQNELPQVNCLKLLSGLNPEVYEKKTIVKGELDFLVKFVDLITSTENRVIANYMLWRAVLQSKDFLSEEWKHIEEDGEEDESSSEKKPQWKECLSLLQKKFEIGLASYYVRYYFSDESKDEAMMLMKYIHKEFLKILEDSDWMDEKTREKAEEKANAIKTYIGYPKELLNDTFMTKIYQNLTITNDSYLESNLAIQRWDADKLLSKFSKPYEEISEKIHSNQFDSIIDVDASYDTIENSIAIPAGILHDAFYDKDRPIYMNFGLIGSIIGHEITHGFDNGGRHFDKDGYMVNWWDKKSDEHFRKKVKCIIDQYDNYTTDVGMKVNGEKTQNENIADNGGLKEAYLAYRSWTMDHGIEPLLPGVNYTQNQIFWLSAAHVWCSKYTPETLKEMIVVDPHSPGKFRIIGPVSNLAEFSKDFKCSPDAPMNRKYKCQVW